jgi:hypothetical protein
MDRSPSRIGCQDLVGAGPMLGGKEFARRNDLTDREGAELDLNELMKPDQVRGEASGQSQVPACECSDWLHQSRRCW